MVRAPGAYYITLLGDKRFGQQLSYWAYRQPSVYKYIKTPLF